MLDRYLGTAPRLHQNRYTRFQQKLSRENTADDSLTKAKLDFPFNLLFIVALLLIVGLFCQLPYDVFMRGMKSVAFGMLAIFFSWEVIYFDSITPGISPPFPLRFEKTRESFVRALHTSYLFSIINGVMFSIMIYLWT